MRERRKLIVVANRGPVAYARSDSGERITRRGGGGLVTALRSLVTQHDVTWIGSAMSDEDRAVAAEHGGGAFGETFHDGSPYRLRLVPHEPAAYDRFYNVVANPTLWFIQHYMWGLADEPDVGPAFHAAWTDGYVPVNEAFAAAVCAELEREPDATVFFQDYHLYLAPSFVRARRPGALSSHFVHIPWPDTDYWTVLPAKVRKAVHEGLLANDVVGLHTNRWRLNFLRACADILGATVDVDASTVEHEGRRTLVTSHPISVDTAEFAGLRESEPVLDEERRIEERRRESLVVRVDRTDPSKNIVRGFRAFALFLERHPEWHGRVTFLALLDPSRQDVPAYADYRAAIEREVEIVNERFRSDAWTPVELDVADNFARSVAAYKQYDVLLVNAVFDGLNLVSKEAPLVNGRGGVLVLSENAGAHEELAEWVLTINPFDLDGQARAIHAGLEMDADERQRRLEGIRTHVGKHDLAAWVAAQLADLARV